MLWRQLQWHLERPSLRVPAAALLFELGFVLIILPLVFLNLVAVLVSAFVLACRWGFSKPSPGGILGWPFCPVNCPPCLWSLVATAGAVLLFRLNSLAPERQESLFDLFRNGYQRLRQFIGLDPTAPE